MLHQSEVQVFKKYSQTKLQMTREALVNAQSSSQRNGTGRR
jgi:hypothetical protein